MKMKNNFFSCFLAVTTILLLIIGNAFAQAGDTTTTAPPQKDRTPMRDIFQSGYILNNQTVIIPAKKTLEFVIQHRFGKLNTKDFDLGGLYAPSNIRIGLNYSITKRILVGVGTTKNNQLQDLNWKCVILKQTVSGNIPLSITYFGDATMDVRAKIYPKLTNRLSYFHQLIFAKKFFKAFSLQVAPSYAHFNMVDSLVIWNNYGISASGRIRVNRSLSVLLEYNYLLTKQPSAIINVKPGLSIGLETETGGHAFQIFVGSLESLSNQYDLLNKNDFTKKDLLIGFNITRLFEF